MKTNKLNQPLVTTKQGQNGLGIAGMIIGIVAVLLSCIFIGGFIGIIGFILSIIGITQKNKKTGTSIAGIVLNAIAIFIMVFMLIIGGSDKGESNTEQKIESSLSQAEKYESESTIESTTESEVPPSVGDTVEGETWKITLLDAKEYENISDDYYIDEPTDGYKYLALFFEVENVSNKDDYFNYFYVESYLDGYNTDITFTLNQPEGYSLLSGDVASGKKLKGCLIYEVPTSGWSELEISYKNGIGKTKKVAIFLVTPNDIAE